MVQCVSIKTKASHHIVIVIISVKGESLHDFREMADTVRI